jgi:hypothetical protein
LFTKYIPNNFYEKLFNYAVEGKNFADVKNINRNLVAFQIVGF